MKNENKEKSWIDALIYTWYHGNKCLKRERNFHPIRVEDVMIRTNELLLRLLRHHPTAIVRFIYIILLNAATGWQKVDLAVLDASY